MKILRNLSYIQDKRKIKGISNNKGVVINYILIFFKYVLEIYLNYTRYD